MGEERTDRAGGLPEKRIRAIGLISGGLDSTLAAALMKGMGVGVLGVNFSTGFCVTDHKRAVRRDTDPKKLRNEALRAGADLGIKVEVVDISAEYLDIVTRPKHGYGKNVNPCIDCRAFMLRTAGEIMRRERAHFVFTGEVLGQRPMSQHRRAMRTIEKDAGLEGLILRPLSAQHLEPTIPEMRGWVDREQLLALEGRTRKPQMALIQDLGITDYPNPAGGCCFLADENFARKFRDLVSHSDERLDPEELLLLKLGRHLRISEGVKIVAGRDEPENNFLERHVEGRWACRTEGFGSPLTLVQGEPTREELETIARITARYSQGRGEPEVEVVCSRRSGDEEEELRLRVAPMPPREVEGFRIRG
jgi:hypothetical protein